MSNGARQAEYLRAIGVEVWRRRGMAPPPPVVPAAAPAAAVGVPAPDATPPGDDWAALQAEVAACTRCELHRTRTQTVFGVGDREADWLIIGEAPGAEEDRRGEPFVGRAGQLLDNMLAAIGLDRATAYITNILKCRPPDNRDPQAGEVAACEPYLQRQIALIRPRLILAVGRVAAQNLLKTDLPLARLRGRIHHYGPQRIPLIVTYHPAYLLRTPADKRKAWEDLQLAVRVFRGGGAVGGGQ